MKANDFTPKQQEVLDLLVMGLQDKEIARRLGKSRQMVAIHVGEIRRRLGARNRVEAVALAVRAGLA